MKKTLRSLFAIAAVAMAFTGCIQNEAQEPVDSAELKTVTFEAVSPATKTTFTAPEGNTYPTIWNEGDMIKIALNFEKSSDATVNPSADFKTATFTSTIAQDASSYKFYAMSPSSAYLSSTSKDDKGWGFTVPNSQTPTALSVDPAAQILVAESTTTTEAPEKVTLSFSHWTAYAKMNITNVNLGESAVKSVSVSAETDIAGRWYYYCEDMTHKDGETVVNSGSKSITINTSSLENIWFALAPVDMSGKKMSVTVNTEMGTFTKEFTFGENRKFESGKISIFTVDMAGVPVKATEVYSRISNIAELVDGSEVIIASASDELPFAMSTTQNGNNRAQIQVNMDGDNILDPSSDVEVFKVEQGTVANTYYFRATRKAGYIFAPGSGNYLRTTDQKSDAASWTVTIDSETKAFEIVSCASVDQKYLKYNKSSSIFSCYKSGQMPVAIYKLPTEGVGKKDPKLAVEIYSATISEGESIEIGATAAEGLTIEYSTSDPSVATVEDDMIMGVAEGNCVITVSVAETDTYKAYAVSIPVTVRGAAKPLSKILSDAQGKLDLSSSKGDIGIYQTGECVVVAASGNNFIVNDGTAAMLLFKSGATLKSGDVITMYGKVTNYYGIAEINNPEITLVSSGATVEHGTPAEFTESAISAFMTAPVVTYAHARGVLGTDGKNLSVGSQALTLFNALTSEVGKTIDVYGYSIGKSSKNTINFINLSYKVVESEPSLSIDNASKTWAYDETDPFVVNVTCTNGSWSVTPSSLDWASVVVEGDKITVTPKGQNTSDAAYESVLTVTHSANPALKATVALKQSKKPAEGGAAMKLESSDIKAAHTSSWSYTSGSKSITASDGSVWTAVNTYANKDQVTIQMNKGKSGYVLTPSVPEGKSISKIIATCTTDAAGTKASDVTRTFDIIDAISGEVIVAEIQGDALTAGKEIDGNHSQLKIAPNEKTGGACYILDITIQY